MLAGKHGGKHVLAALIHQFSEKGMTDLDIGFRPVFLKLPICIHEEHSIAPNIMIRFVVPHAGACKTFAVAYRIVINKGLDFTGCQHGIHLLSVVSS